MKNDEKRYSGPALPQRSYRDEFLVECPGCSKAALVKTDNPFFLTNAQLRCYHCYFSLSEKDITRYRAIIKRSCDNCGKDIHTTTAASKVKLSSLTIPCGHCGITRTYKPRIEEYRLVEANPFPYDPVFHCTLWLQCLIKGEKFWAYNKRHLLEIRKYVAAKLRERETLDYTTMVEKLPNFIKQAKNRQVILKAIDRLLAK